MTPVIPDNPLCAVNCLFHCSKPEQPVTDGIGTSEARVLY